MGTNAQQPTPSPVLRWDTPVTVSGGESSAMEDLNRKTELMGGALIIDLQ